MNPSKDRKTFDESYESELGEKLKIVVVPLNQLELVIDVYREDSLKARCRQFIENAALVSVKDSNSIYRL